MDRISGAGEPPFEAGERVCVDSVEGASIYVKRIGSEPDWRPKTLPNMIYRLTDEYKSEHVFICVIMSKLLLRFGIGFVSVVESLIFFEWRQFDRDPDRSPGASRSSPKTARTRR